MNANIKNIPPFLVCDDFSIVRFFPIAPEIKTEYITTYRGAYIIRNENYICPELDLISDTIAGIKESIDLFCEKDIPAEPQFFITERPVLPSDEDLNRYIVVPVYKQKDKKSKEPYPYKITLTRYFNQQTATVDYRIMQLKLIELNSKTTWLITKLHSEELRAANLREEITKTRREIASFRIS